MTMEEHANIKLPKSDRKYLLQLKDQDYLKLYQMKNPMHDQDREKVNLHALDLRNLGQIPEETYQDYYNRFESDIFKGSQNKLKLKEEKMRLNLLNISTRMDQIQKQKIVQGSGMKRIFSDDGNTIQMNRTQELIPKADLQDLRVKQKYSLYKLALKGAKQVEDN
ncbi:UNKNOWN [Stylonychia lemnae]|uniref:Uncharacterized protein n=1 Tax=Stylonychia lemnae TaxID=5949 RepID=A0A078AM82_STYLE|nr:UNKNOWN [Stylonychia lemnae]|eukprot:CDW81943.1 UNKNOWN [Stylonychia lemnae]